MPKDQKYLSISELAEMLKISRQAVFRKIKNKQIIAEKIGRAYAIPKDTLGGMIYGDLSEGLKAEINQGVFRVVKEYGETLKLLAKK